MEEGPNSQVIINIHSLMVKSTNLRNKQPDQQRISSLHQDSAERNPQLSDSGYKNSFLRKLETSVSFPAFSDMKQDAAEIQAQYEQQGYLSAIPILSPEELQQSRDAFAELERKHGEDYTAYSLHNIHKDNEWVMALAKHPRLLEVVTAVLGPDVILLDSRFICKYPVGKPESNGSSDKMEGLPFVAWHQDMTYWGFDGGPVLSVWLALDDSLEDNGALQVIPGSHRSGLLPHHQSKRAGNMLSVNQEIPEELVQSEKALLCPLQAGQMSVHDGLLVHASDPNTSNRRRCGYVIRYVPTCAYPIQDPERPRSFPDTVLVSGFDKYNHFSSEL